MARKPLDSVVAGLRKRTDSDKISGHAYPQKKGTEEPQEPNRQNRSHYLNNQVRNDSPIRKSGKT